MYEFIHSTYFKDLISSFSSGVTILNSDFIIYAINEAAIDILQRDRNDILSQNYEKFFIDLEHFKDLKAIIQEVAKSKTRGHFIETTMPKHDGTLLHLDISVSPLIYYEKLFGIFIEMKDVTHIYQMLDKEKKILEEKRAVEKHRTKSLKHFALAVAHQIRNPVTVIGGLSNRLLRCNTSPEKAKKYLQTIFLSGQRLEMIIRAVDDFMFMESHKPEKIKISSILQRSKIYLDKKFPELFNKVKWHEEGTEQSFFCYPQLLTKAINEVTKNCLEAMEHEGGKVKIISWLENDNFIISIKDNGCGIEKSIKPFIFDLFFTTHEKSVGMGLCKVEKIMKEHKGSIQIKDNNSKGTTVILSFPQTEDIYAKCRRQSQEYALTA